MFFAIPEVATLNSKMCHLLGIHALPFMILFYNLKWSTVALPRVIVCRAKSFKDQNTQFCISLGDLSFFSIVQRM